MISMSTLLGPETGPTSRSAERCPDVPNMGVQIPSREQLRVSWEAQPVTASPRTPKRCLPLGRAEPGIGFDKNESVIVRMGATGGTPVNGCPASTVNFRRAATAGSPDDLESKAFRRTTSLITFAALGRWRRRLHLFHAAGDSQSPVEYGFKSKKLSTSTCTRGASYRLKISGRMPGPISSSAAARRLERYRTSSGKPWAELPETSGAGMSQPMANCIIVMGAGEEQLPYSGGSSRDAYSIDNWR